MAEVNLSDRLAKRIGKRTKIKRDKSGKRIGGGTKITKGLVESVRADEAGLVEIRENNTEQIENAINRAIAAALEECGLAAERFAKAKCPVDTGRLRNSITHALDMDEEAVYIGTNVSYAPYQENGTHGKDGKHFLRDAAQNHGSYYAKIIKSHLENG
jgi:HK97 gp10 family phage protein